MCGRYVIAKASADLVSSTGADWASETLWNPSYNIAPTTTVPIIVERLVEDQLLTELHLAKWGLIPPWAKDEKVGVRAFNARSETVTEKPTFKNPIRSQRCALPADGYYEWLKHSDNSKTPYYTSPANPEEMIYFAGIYQWWKTPENQWLLSCSMLTMDSPSADDPDPVLAELATLHHRIPIALHKDFVPTWIQPEKLSLPETEALVEEAQVGCFDVARTWKLQEVDRAVGNVRNNTPELIAPVK